MKFGRNSKVRRAKTRSRTMATEPSFTRSLRLALKDYPNISYSIQIHKRVADALDMEQKVMEKVCRTFGINSSEVERRCFTRFVATGRSPTELTHTRMLRHNCEWTPDKVHALRTLRCIKRT